MGPLPRSPPTPPPPFCPAASTLSAFDWRNHSEPGHASQVLIMTYSGCYISGAHFNPAINLAVWLRGKTQVGVPSPAFADS